MFQTEPEEVEDEGEGEDAGDAWSAPLEPDVFLLA